MWSATDNTLMAVSGTAATGLWAVGYWLSPSGLMPLVLRYDTTQPSPSWALVCGVPSPGNVETVLTGVDVLAADDVWAVGYLDNGSVKQPLALHWDGSTWTGTPVVPGAGLLRDVVAIGPGNVWAAGTYFKAATQRYQTLVVHYDGTAWTTVISANAHSDNELIGMAANPAGSAITLVGRAGPNPLIEQATCPTGPVSPRTRAAAPVPAAPVPPGDRPAARPAAQHPSADDPDLGDDHRSGSRSGHRRHE